MAQDVPKTVRRSVIPTEHVRAKVKGRPICWAFTYEDLAALFQCSVKSVVRMIASGKLNPSDLQSIVDAYNSKAIYQEIDDG